MKRLSCNCAKNKKCYAPLPEMASSEKQKVFQNILKQEREKRVEGIVMAHNILRRTHENTGDLEWDDEIAAFAQNYADLCKNKKNKECPGGCFMEHNPENNRYGENLAWLRTYEENWMNPRDAPESNAADIVQGWYDERYWYDSPFPSISSKNEPNHKKNKKMGFMDHKSADCLDDNICCVGTRQTGHYTQVVSKNSKKIGCAVSVCTWKDKDGSLVKDELWVCNYDPAGNYKNCKKWEPDNTCKPENLYFMEEHIAPGKKDWNVPSWMVFQDKLVESSDYFILQ